MYAYFCKAKILSEWKRTISTYIAGSVGIGFNRSSKFLESPYIPEEVPAPPFSDGSINNALTYSAEIGIQKALNQNMFVGIGYNFSDWGKSALGPAQGQTTSSGITMNHFYTNGLQINFTTVG